MALINSEGKLLGRFNIVDTLFTGAVIMGIAGVFLVQSGTHVTSGQVVQGEADIVITVQVPNLRTLDPDLFKEGDKTSITIRNQPRGNVLIQETQYSPVKLTVMSPGGKVQAVEDLAQGNSYDFTLRLKDHAKITEDGYVTEGVKVKVGLPIELEGFKYRVSGKVLNVEAVQ